MNYISKDHVTVLARHEIVTVNALDAPSSYSSARSLAPDGCHEAVTNDISDEHPTIDSFFRQIIEHEDPWMSKGECGLWIQKRNEPDENSNHLQMSRTCSQ